MGKYPVGWTRDGITVVEYRAKNPRNKYLVSDRCYHSPYLIPETWLDMFANEPTHGEG